MNTNNTNNGFNPNPWASYTHHMVDDEKIGPIPMMQTTYRGCVIKQFPYGFEVLGNKVMTYEQATKLIDDTANNMLMLKYRLN